MARHRTLLSLIVLSTSAFVGTVLFTAMAAITEPKGLFLSTTNSVYSQFQLEITPASWTFWMWPIILIWNGLWVIYVPFTIFKSDEITASNFQQSTASVTEHTEESAQQPCTCDEITASNFQQSTASVTEHTEESAQQPCTWDEITASSFQQSTASLTEHTEESAQQPCTRKHMDKIGSPAKVHSSNFFLLWFCINLFHILWLVLWDRHYFFPAWFLIAFIPAAGSGMLAMSYRNCFNHGAWLSIHFPADTWCIRILVHNGLAAYVTWTFVTCLINAGILLKYDGQIPDSRVSLSILHLLLFGLLFWFLLESFVFEEYVRYTVTIYPVINVALFGIFFRREIPSNNLSHLDLIIIIVLVVSLVACVLRLLLLSLCHNVRPLFPMENCKSLDTSLNVLDQSCHRSSSQVSSTAIEETPNSHS